MSDQAASPICARCRQPIAGASRRDRFGNSYCEACAQALIGASQRAKQRAAGLKSIQANAAAVPKPAPPEPAPVAATSASTPLAAAPAPASASAPRPKRPATAPPAPAEGAPIIPDLSIPEKLTADGTIALEPEQEKPKLHTRQCESCNKLINAEVSVCPYCQYDTRSGPPGKEPLHTCMNCGYDLAGLPEPICPECGTVNPKPRKKSARRIELEQESREIARKAYTRPAIMLGAGLLGLLIITASLGHPTDILAYGLKYLFDVPVGLGVYIVCCLLWIGFDMPLHLIAFRLAAIYAVVDALDAVGHLLGIFAMLLWPVIYLTYLGLLMEELDLELQDAWILAFLTSFAKFIVGMILAYILIYLGIKAPF
jgi:hypothetical protein